MGRRDSWVRLAPLVAESDQSRYSPTHAGSRKKAVGMTSGLVVLRERGELRGKLHHVDLAKDGVE